MRNLFLICLLFPCIWAKIENVTVDYFINLINSRQTSWRAGKYFRSNTTRKTLTHSFTRVEFRIEPNVKVKPCNPEGIKIPETFDARTEWPDCADVTGKIRNQGLCDSCWAFAATSVMSDRICIQSGGKEKFQFSPQDLISCCGYCDSGCKMGMPSKAWDYYTHFGIVSGGDFFSFQGCKPYQESEYYYKESSTCTENCYNPDYKIPYSQDKHFGEEYYMVNKTPECIQAEIMEKGPVQALMKVYDDFYFYKDGVYFYTVGGSLNTHSVKILGWGTERGLPYWLVANSWGCQWGNLNGFFKIRRGHDECAIEQHIIAGNPKLERASSYPWWAIISTLSVFVVVILVVGGLGINQRTRDIVKKYLRFK